MFLAFGSFEVVPIFATSKVRCIKGSQLISAYQLSYWHPIQDETDTLCPPINAMEANGNPQASNGIQTKPTSQILLLCWVSLDRIRRPYMPLSTWLKSKEKETRWSSALSRQVGTDNGYQLTDNVSHIIMWNNIAAYLLHVKNVLNTLRCVRYYSIRISAVLQRNRSPRSRKVPCWVLWIVTWLSALHDQP